MNPLVTVGLLVAYFALLYAISLLPQNRQQDNNGFFLGNRRSPWWVVAIGMVGASLSGVTFVSVPGMVRDNGFLYIQTVLGFFVGYLLIANILLPLYYRIGEPSIYAFLGKRFGPRSRKTGSSFFFLSKIIGAAARLYVVVIILQTFLFDDWNIPFPVTAATIILMIWLYTRRSGIKTIVWTDLFQTICLLTAMVLIIVQLAKSMGMGMGDTWRTIASDSHFKLFEWHDWGSKQHFVKQFLSGIFIALVMTGLDQDMMQKNLSINSLKDAKRNIYTYGFTFLPVNFLFLCLGTLLIVFAQSKGYVLPQASDDILPTFAAKGFLGPLVTLFFMIGIISASFSSADSAMTALTTSFCVDLLEKKDDVRLRRRVHIGVAVAMLLILLVIRAVNNTSLLDAIYVIAGYTYGPLLGLFAFGLLTKRPVNDRAVPFVAIVSPLICALLQYLSTTYLNYSFGYELLMINGLITFTGLLLWK